LSHLTRTVLTESEETWVEGIKQLVLTTLVLALAWAIGDAMEALGPDKYIASGVSRSVDKRAISVLVFILSAFISLATGTSWGTSACCCCLKAHVSYI
jgi:Na+/H+ antiporter NhaC